MALLENPVVFPRRLGGCHDEIRAYQDAGAGT